MQSPYVSLMFWGQEPTWRAPLCKAEHDRATAIVRITEEIA